MAVLTFDVEQGVTKDEARILSDRLAIELDRTGQFTLINRQRMAEQLALLKFSNLGICSASECAVEAGRILGASHMVYGSIGKVGETYSLNSYLVSVESGATLQSFSTDVSGGIEEMLTQGIAENAARLAAPAQGGTASRPTCAVLTFDSRGGVSTDEVRLFSDRFAIELDSLRQYTLVPRSKMEEVLQEQQFARSDNCSAAECAMEAGKLLGVRYMAYGSIGLIGSLYTINTYLVDVETGIAAKTAITDFRGDKERLLTEGMRANAVSLLDLEKQMGFAEIQMSPIGAKLYLDGVETRPGRVPVTAGQLHSVTARQPRHEEYNRSFSVGAGETKRIMIALKTIEVPVPGKTASALQGQKPPDAQDESTWWGNNWKWASGSAAALVVGGIALAAGGGGGGGSAVPSSDYLQITSINTRNNPVNGTMAEFHVTIKYGLSSLKQGIVEITYGSYIRGQYVVSRGSGSHEFVFSERYKSGTWVTATLSEYPHASYWQPLSYTYQAY